MNETNWWVDRTGSVHTQAYPANPGAEAIAMGKVYLDSKSGVITHINDRPADVAFVSQQLLDVLHAQFPGTRWWIKDPAPTPTQKAAS